MEPALSVSTNTNEDSTSDLGEDDDIDMQSPLGTPAAYTPLSPVFPAEKFAAVWQNLKRHPSWTIQPGNTADCIAATASIIDDQLAMPSHADTVYMQRLMRDVVPDAFEKFFNENSIKTWSPLVQDDILHAAFVLMDLITAQLKHLAPSESTEIDEDLISMLSAMALSLDRFCPYHEHTCHSAPSPKVERLIRQRMAEARAQGVTWSELAADVDPGYEDPQGLLGTPHACHVALINYLGLLQLFEMLCQALEQDSVKYGLVEAIMEPLAKVMEWLSKEAQVRLANACQALLQKRLAPAIEKDVELLSDSGRDRMFNSASSIFLRLPKIIAAHLEDGEQLAFRMVSAVQRAFVEKLLAKPVFQRHMTAVREVLNMLRAAQKLRSSGEPCDERAIKELVEWLVQKDIVQALLRAHLHQRQYMDQVQRVLKILAAEGGFQSDHLELLWALTEKVDTFEAVKNNVYSVLGDLAKDLHGPELDLLFSKFEACTGWPAPDTLKAMDLLKRLAHSDDEGALAHRVLGLLWELTFAPGAPAEVAQSPVLSDSLHHYAGMGSEGIDMVWDYITRCIRQIKTDNNPKALDVLTGFLHFLEQFHHKVFTMAIQRLHDQYNVVEEVVSSLEAHRQRLASGGSAEGQSAGDADARQPQQPCSKPYLDFLLTTVKGFGGCLELQYIRRVWMCLTQEPLNPEDLDELLKFLFSLACQAGTRECLIAKEDITRILDDCFPSLDPKLLSLEGYACLKLFMLKAAAADDTLQFAHKDVSSYLPIHQTKRLPVRGCTYLWSVAMDSEKPNIANEARDFLVSLHLDLSEELQQQQASVRSSLIMECCKRLTAARQVLTGSPGTTPATDVSPADYQLSAQRVERCLSILERFAEACQGASAPVTPAHAASFQGPHISLEIMQTHLRFPGHGRIKALVCSNSYVAELRHVIGAKLSQPPAQIRLIYGGQELLNSKLIRDVGLSDGFVIHAAASQKANPAHEPASEAALEQQAASPIILLSKQEGFYNELLCLGDTCRLPGVQHRIKHMLGMLPTDPRLLEVLRRALSSERPAEALKPLLEGLAAPGSPPAQPTRLLYTLEALNSLLIPAALQLSGHEEAVAAMQRTVLSSQCIAVLLSALQTAESACRENNELAAMRSLYAAVQLLISRLLDFVIFTQKPSTAESESSAASMSRDRASGNSASAMDVSASGAVASTASVGSEKKSRAAPSSERRFGDDWVHIQPPGQRREGAMGTGQEHRAESRVAGQPGASLMDAETLDAMCHFFVRHTAYAGRAWDILDDSQSMEPEPSANTLPDEDARLHFQAMQALEKLYTLKPDHLEKLIVGVRELMLESLLNPRHDLVRQTTGGLLRQIAHSPSGHLAVLSLLDGGMAQAERVPHHCTEFFKLLSDLLPTITSAPPETKGAEIQIADRLLKGVLGQLLRPDANMADHVEGSPPNAGGLRLQGKLRLCAALIRVLKRYSVGAHSGGGLIEKLLIEYLFPAANLMAKQKEDPNFSLALVPHAELYVALNARCSTKASRQAALDLLADLMTSSRECLREGLVLLVRLTFALEPQQEFKWRAQPEAIIRQQSGFVGLKNGGATCYMNAVFQQLFMQPSIRALVLGAAEVPAAERKDSVFFQFQRTFGHLALSHRPFFVPRGFWLSFKDYDGEPTNVREHQDAYEFFTRLQALVKMRGHDPKALLQDLVDQHLRDNKEHAAMQEVMGGTFAQQIICRSVPHRSEKDEEFYQISLDVVNKRSLEESLDFYCQGELMEGDNQYFCEEAGRKVDAVKRNCLKVLPHTLVIHLKRFEFDFEAMSRWKIKSRFEFPLELDMWKYTVEGLAERDAASAEVAASASKADAAPGDGPCPATPKAGAHGMQYMYQLKGVVVHSGTANVGHYYSYIKVRKQQGQGPSGGQWFCFDDNTVEPWDIAKLDAECYGGKESESRAAQGLPPSPRPLGVTEYDKQFSAYMLFYERADELEPIDQLRQVSHPAADAQSPAPAALAPASAAAEEVAAESASAADSMAPSEAIFSRLVDPPFSGAGGASQPAPKTSDPLDAGGQSLSAVPVPDLAASCPSVLEDVLRENLSDIIEMQAMDRDLFSFVLQLLQHTAEDTHRKLRRTEPSPSNSPVSESSQGPGGASAPSLSPNGGRSGRVEDSETTAVMLMAFATKFAFKVYLRAHPSLQGDMEQWASALSALGERSQPALRFLMGFLTGDVRITQTISASLFGCEGDCLCLADAYDYLVINYLTATEIEDVRNWVAKVVIDALRQGASQGLLQEPEEAQPGAGAPPSAALSRLLMTMLVHADEQPRATRTYVYRDSNEQMFRILQEYLDLGPAFVEHVAGLRLHGLPLAVPKLSSALYNYTDNEFLRMVEPLEMLALLHCTAALVRRMDPDLTQGQLEPVASNPFRLEPLLRNHTYPLPAWHNLMDKEVLRTFITPPLINDKGVLDWMKFNNSQSSLSLKRVLEAVMQQMRKAPAEELHTAFQEYSELLCVRDKFWSERLTLAIGLDREPTGLLFQALNDQTKPLRRYFAVRMLLCMASEYPEARRFLASQDWNRAKSEIYNIYNRDSVAQQRRCIVSHQEMEKVLQNLEFLTMSEPHEPEEAAASP